MSVSLYFGLPGAGKTTYATYLAVKEQDKINSGRSRYKRVLTNFEVYYPGVIRLDANILGIEQITNSLIIIDEATLVADSRDYKSFSHAMKRFFLLHRHEFNDIVLFTQAWDGVDKRIRVITDRCFYVHKGQWRRWITYAMRVPYGILIPKKGDGGDKFGDIIQGYYKPPLLVRMFSPRIKRKKFYQYFDSFEQVEYKPFVSCEWYSGEAVVCSDYNSDLLSDDERSILDQSSSPDLNSVFDLFSGSEDPDPGDENENSSFEDYQ